MMSRSGKLFIISCVLLTACSTTKNIPRGDALYKGAKVTLHASNITVRQKKVFRDDLEDMARPKPNSTFLGIPFKLMIWNMFSAKKEKSFFGKLKSKWGQPPVLLSQVDLKANTDIMQNYLQNKGFFKATVTGDTVVRRKKAYSKYDAQAGNQYKIDSVFFPTDSSELSAKIREASKKTLLIKGKPYDLDVIKGERDRVDAYLKEIGYYYFSPDDLLAQVDSSVGSNQVNIKMVIKPATPAVSVEPFKINNVYIYSDYSLNTARTDTAKANVKFFEGYYVIDPKNKFKPKLYRRIMLFDPGDLYSRSDHNKSLNRLINLNVFKFVKNRFERADVDSPKLNVYYYLTPYPAKSIRAEIGANNKSNNMNGSVITFGYHHRNAFRAGEQLDFKVYAGTEASFGGTYQGYSTYRAGGEVKLGVPRFLVPFFNPNTRSGYVPRSNFDFAYEALNRHKLYTMNSFRTDIGYSWKESVTKTHEFNPISINYVLPANITSLYKQDLATNPTLRHVTDTQFILGSNYQFTLDQQALDIQKINSFYFNGLADASGNLAGLFVSPTKTTDKRLFGVPFSQYLKFEADGRYYRKIGIGSTWANRIDFGYGLPYGNSTQLPYIKQFFTGGNNSIRAFRSRTVGPGTYHALPTQNGYIPDQTGDIKLEFNTEYRPQLSGPLYGAIFIDAGNIWLKNPDPNKPGAEFTKDFLKQLAVGTGVGLRLDIQLFVIRFDVAFPIRKPWLSNPWVMNQIRLGNAAWRKENVIYNLAIGYPF
jgi:outer membrane protein insertion porin family